MGEYRVKISDLAKQDIRETMGYIRDELLNPIAVENTTLAILDGISKLENIPARVPLIRDERLAKMGIRGLNIKNYTAFFRIKEESKIIDVVRVLYSRRDWQAIL